VRRQLGPAVLKRGAHEEALIQRTAREHSAGGGEGGGEGRDLDEYGVFRALRRARSAGRSCERGEKGGGGSEVNRKKVELLRGEGKGRSTSRGRKKRGARDEDIVPLYYASALPMRKGAAQSSGEVGVVQSSREVESTGVEEEEEIKDVMSSDDREILVCDTHAACTYVYGDMCTFITR